MLVLSRKIGESVRIADEIEVVVLDIGRNRVRLGFRCPPHISVKRNELSCEIALKTATESTVEPQEAVCV